MLSSTLGQEVSERDPDESFAEVAARFRIPRSVVTKVESPKARIFAIPRTCIYLTNTEPL